MTEMGYLGVVVSLVVCLHVFVIPVQPREGHSSPDSIKRSASSRQASQLRLGALLVTSGATFLAGRSLLLFKEENDIDASKHRDLFSLIRPGSKVLEVGFGTQGTNLDYYPANAAIDLYAIDPKLNPYSQLNSKLVDSFAERGVNLGLYSGICEKLPFDSQSFDVVVSTLVFCTVTDPHKSLQEISRVLKSGGLFLCVEHILAEYGTVLQTQQNLLDPLQQLLADGCHLTRTTDQLLIQNVDTSQDIKVSSNNGIFSHILSMDYVELSTQWPISRQVYAAIQK